jgi:hypothetical protein
MAFNILLQGCQAPYSHPTHSLLTDIPPKVPQSLIQSSHLREKGDTFWGVMLMIREHVTRAGFRKPGQVGEVRG